MMVRKTATPKRPSMDAAIHVSREIKALAIHVSRLIARSTRHACVSVRLDAAQMSAQRGEHG